MLEYKDQSSTDLRYYLFDSDIDVTSMKVMESKKLKLDNVDVEFGILGASHYLKVTKDGKTYTEIFACATLNETNCRIATNSKYEELMHIICDTLYSSESHTYTLKDGVTSEIMNEYLEDVRRSSNIHMLKHDFPSNGSKWPTYTVVFLLDYGDDIEFHSIHAYQDESSFVVTQTNISTVSKK